MERSPGAHARQSILLAPKMKARWSRSIGACAVALASSCSTEPAAPLPTVPSDAQASDSGADAAPADAGDAAPSGPFPAFKPDIGLMTSGGGSIVPTPNLVTVTWAIDPLGPALEDFDEKLGPSQYWSAVKEYGVVSTTASPQHVVVPTAPPATWEDTDLENWLVTELQDPASGWPAPDANTVYVVYSPPSVQITTGGADICASNSAEHARLPVGPIPEVSFVLTFGSCMWSTTLEDSYTAAAAITIAGAVTDPDYATWNGYDNPHYAWQLFTNGAGEIGLACAAYTNDYFRPGPDLPYAVGRLWSNASATAGHDPCVPAEPGPYYSATPLGMKSIDVNVGSSALAATEVITKGYRIAPGKSGSFQVGLYSDGPTSPWSVQAVEGDGMNPPASSVLELSTDRSSGNNGDRITVSVSVKRAPPGQTGVLMTVVSTQNQVQHFTPVLIGTY